MLTEEINCSGTIKKNDQTWRRSYLKAGWPTWRQTIPHSHTYFFSSELQCVPAWLMTIFLEGRRLTQWHPVLKQSLWIVFWGFFFSFFSKTLESKKIGPVLHSSFDWMTAQPHFHYNAHRSKFNIIHVDSLTKKKALKMIEIKMAQGSNLCEHVSTCGGDFLTYFISTTESLFH